MSDLLYIDLLIDRGDFVLNADNEPELCNNRYRIGHRARHFRKRLSDAPHCRAQPPLRADIFTQLELLVESDERIVPDTVEVSEEGHKRLWVTANTYDFGNISYRVDV